MTQRTLLIPPIKTPTNASVNPLLEITLVDRLLRPMIGMTADNGIVGSISTCIPDAGISVDLTPQSEIAPESYWKITITVRSQSINYHIIMPDGTDPILLADAIAYVPPVIDPETPTDPEVIP